MTRINELLIRFRIFPLIFFGAIGLLLGSITLINPHGLLPEISDITIQKALFVNVEMLLLFFFYPRYLMGNRSFDSKLNNSLLYIISNAIFLYPFLVYYAGTNLVSLPNFQMLLPYITTAFVFLWGIGAVLLVIFLHRRINPYLSSRFESYVSWKERINIAFDPEKTKALGGQPPSSERFRAALSMLQKIPVVSSLYKFFYAHGLWYSLTLITFILIGFGLRVWNIEELPPYVDEIPHLVAAKELYLGASLNEVSYQRSFFDVTVPVFLSYLTFGMSLWSARIAGVVFNMLAIVPLYLVGMRINRYIAWIAVGLYTTNPWIIATARSVREYAYYPFYVYLIILLMQFLLEDFPIKFVISRDYKYFFRKKKILAIASLGIILLLTIVPLKSTMIVIGLAFFVLLLIFLGNLDYQNRTNIIFVIGIGLVSIFAVFFISRILRPPLFEANYFLLLFINPEQQWYFERLPLIGLFLTIITIIASLIYGRVKSIVSLIALNFITFLGFFTFFFNRYTKPRYGSFIEIWFVLILAIGLYIVYIFLKGKFQQKYLPAVLLALLFFNWDQVLLPSVHIDSGSHPITNEFHYETKPVEDILIKEKKDGDVLVSSNFSGYLDFFAPVSFETTFTYFYYKNESTNMIYRTIYSYPSGWVILDENSGFAWSKPLPFEDFSFRGKTVKYRGLLGNFFVYRWGE